MVLSLIVQSPLCAQRNLPLLEDGKRWEIKWAGAGLEYYYTNEITGDTIINDVSYRILDESFLREDDSKVYIWEKYDEREIVLYDFDLKEGDLFEDYVVLCVDTIVVHGISRKRIGLSDNYYIDLYQKYLGDKYDEKDPMCWLVCWVEGIGSQYSPSHYFDWQIAGPSCRTMKCVINDICMFTYDDFFAKPVSSISNPVSSISVSNAVYDLQGRRVQTPQRGGLYIKDGRKLIYR
jgi:hypothetical protein